MGPMSQSPANAFRLRRDGSAHYEAPVAGHVSVLGDVPPAAVDKRVRQILSTGEAASLPDEILKALNHRRLLAKQIQPWVEAHHRPGMIFDVGDRVGMLPPPDGR
jgi:hypothetical protein